MALVKCPECSKEVSDKAEACPVCAFPIAAHFNKVVDSPRNHDEELHRIYAKVDAEISERSEVANDTKGKPLDLKVVVFMVIVVCAFLFYLGIHDSNSISSTHSTSQPSEQSLVDKRKWFASAKAILTDRTQKVSDDELVRIKSSLESVSADMPEYAEAQKLLPDVSSRIEKVEKARAIKEDKERKLAEDAKYTKAGKRIHAKHPEWDADDCNTIGKHEIRVGMTADQVRAAWGRPYRINHTSNAYAESEQWVMHELGNSYVYFENGICTTIQN